MTPNRMESVGKRETCIYTVVGMQENLGVVEESKEQTEQGAVVQDAPCRCAKYRAERKYSWSKERMAQRHQKERDMEYIFEELIY
jgi:hypothetical protein